LFFVKEKIEKKIKTYYSKTEFEQGSTI